MSRFTWRNTVTSYRTLVKPHKALDATERFTRSCFREKLIWKVSQKTHLKETIWSLSFSFLKTCNFTKKEPHGSYFPVTFEKAFQNTVLCTGKALAKEQKETEVFISDLKSFTKVIREKVWWSLSLVKWQPPATLLKKNSIAVIFLS